MKVTPVIASTFATDGGAMFGLVPRPIWSKLIAPDAQNRIPQHAHVLLVELPDGRKGLIDTGCGPAKKFSGDDIERHGLGAGWPLIERLSALGIAPAEIAFVVFTHLHWDHAGGASPGEGALTFSNAVHYVHAQEWTDATAGDPLLYKSYPAGITAPLRDVPDDQLRRVAKDREKILPGITMIRSGGHTRGHCIVALEARDGIEINHPEMLFMFPPRRIVFAGDVCPMRHNLRMVYQASYDTYPLETRAWKRTWLPEFAGDGTLVMFDHDPDLFGATIKAHTTREFVVDKTLHAALGGQDMKPLDDLHKRGRFTIYRQDPFIAGV